MKVQHALTDTLYPLLIAVVIGFLAGLGAVLFRWLIDFEIGLFWAGEGDFVERYQQAHWGWRLTAPMLAGLLLSPLLLRLAPEVRGPGVPEVMSALTHHDGIIRHRVTLLKSLSTATFIASGCSVGREGPIVQIGSSIGSTLTQLLRLGPDQRRLAIVCGAAAGIAATFQAPMAGTLFAVEILLFDLEVASLSNIVIASVTGTVVSKAIWSDETLFQIPFFTLSHPGELLLYVLMGVVAGFFSLLFMAYVFTLPKLFAALRIPKWLAPATAGLAVGAIGLLYPQALGVGYETINQALHGNSTLAMVAVLLVAKLLTTGLCVGSGMSGGIFVPSLFLGAMLGCLFGHLADLFWQDLPLSAAHYGLVGMGAIVTGTTLAPITAILTIFELTYNYQVILPLMAACIPSLIVVRLFHGFSIYETKLLLQGIRIVRGHDANRLRALQVRETMCREYQVLREHTPFEQLVSQIIESPFPHFMVLDEEDGLVGVLSLRDIRSRLADPAYRGEGVSAAQLMTREVVTVREDQNLEDAFRLFAKGNFSFLPVLAGDRAEKVVGYLKKDDLLVAYDQHILRAQVHPISPWVCPWPRPKDP
ncbi:chloride channel protein [Desulfogranum mediterraneum]|uniref:chloride channel protein n=1 Tax=Desulfogranum mediterraneum TaxID=160661 RepID=UPI00040F8701|nr:chloride channel protein [Desulfogranum mediterraneum]